MSSSALRRSGVLALCLLAVIAAVYVVRGQASAAVDGPLAGDMKAIDGTKPGIRVLFVGNSLTQGNDLYAIVNELAKQGGGERVYSAAHTRGGQTMRQADADPDLDLVITNHSWDYVVLQEQSQLLSFTTMQRLRESEPYVLSMARKVKNAGATPLLFETWAYKAGDPTNASGDTYDAMRQRLSVGYGEVAKDVKIDLVPVGHAWDGARKDTSIELYAADGKHPSPAGTYLVASTFYEAITGTSPAGNRYTAGLPKAQARTLQAAADAAVN